MNAKTFVETVSAFAFAATAFAMPEVTGVTMTQNSRTCAVEIKYTLSEPAVVTLDILTNATANAATGWASIGGEHIWNATGDVWRKVETAGEHTISWQPAESWTDGSGDGFKVADGCALAEVSAWPPSNTPDYMVVDISEGATPGSQRYYPRADFLPGTVPGEKGGVTNNAAYKTTKLVMRKIPAKGVTWTMGSLPTEPFRDQTSAWVRREATHEVTLAANYYIGIFEFTQGQCATIRGSYASSFITNAVNRHLRPQENMTFNAFRGDHSNPPGSPKSDSVVGKLNERTGLDFELPTEAQWEFACRAGNGSPYWNDGTAMAFDAGGQQTNADLDRLARYALNGGGWTYSNGAYVQQWIGDLRNSEMFGTAPVGSYAPNSWGLYDTIGNVFETCLDWVQPNGGISAAPNGAANISATDPTKTYDGQTPADDGARVARGGSFRGSSSAEATWRWCRPGTAWGWKPNQTQDHGGFRLVCTAGLE